jgi:hypothetical protein
VGAAFAVLESQSISAEITCSVEMEKRLHEIYRKLKERTREEVNFFTNISTKLSKASGKEKSIPWITADVCDAKLLNTVLEDAGIKTLQKLGLKGASDTFRMTFPKRIQKVAGANGLRAVVILCLNVTQSLTGQTASFLIKKKTFKTNILYPLLELFQISAVDEDGDEDADDGEDEEEEEEEEEEGGEDDDDETGQAGGKKPVKVLIANAKLKLQFCPSGEPSFDWNVDQTLIGSLSLAIPLHCFVLCDWCLLHQQHNI